MVTESKCLPLVSIIVPVYNVEDYLCEALDCLAAQTYSNFEVIAVNDGSTDGSLQILKRYNDEKIFRNFRIISQKNKGLSEARNAGLPFVQGKYLYFFDSDDKLAPDCLEKCVTFAEEKELDMVHFGASIISEHENHDESAYLKSNLTHEKIYSINEFYKIAVKDIRVPVWLYFLKADLVVNKLTFYPDIVHEDELFTVLVLNNATNIGALNEEFFKRRLRANSIMTTKNPVMDQKKETSYLIIIRELLKIRKNASKAQRLFLEKRMVAIFNLLFFSTKPKDLIAMLLKKELSFFIIWFRVKWLMIRTVRVLLSTFRYEKRRD